jgi:hypothetical protein
VSVQDRCMVCARRTIGSEIILDAPFLPLGDEAQVEARFSPFRDRLGSYFGHTGWKSLVTWVMWNLSSFHLETVLVSMQDRCMVCARCTIGLEIVLILTQDRYMVCVECIIGSEIILDTRWNS